MAILDDKIKRFLRDGNGYINGNGNGYINGSGNGYGDGSGNGYGYGSGYGNGYGNGNGNDNVYGNGDGNGYGGGNGNGGDIKTINGMTVNVVDGLQTIITHIRGDIAKGYILERNVYLKPCYVIRRGDVYAHGATLREAREALEDKVFSDMSTDDRIAAFVERFSAGGKYPAKDYYEWHHKLTGSCEMGRKTFAANHGIDIDNDMLTVAEFIHLTKDDYGSQIIRQLAEVMGVDV